MAGVKGDALRRSLRDLVDAASPGDRLPPERNLIDDFGVARETLRRAIDELVVEGRLTRRHGVGTFVTRPKITQQFRVQSFTEDMRARGMTSSSRVVSGRVVLAGARIGNLLQISPGDKTLAIRRLRLADGEPMALETLHVPAALVPDLHVDDLSDRSLYETLATDYGIVIASGRQTIEATVTDADESRLLGVPQLSPALAVERVTWTADETRVEAVHSVYRGDRYRFEVDLIGQSKLRANSGAP
ncbi:GntR family transcriptional regulator [Agromyces binzhouensis]|uniref:GntR family transcriptional regulator n=1 Tax=Agromyces binzhouensis TaxID=1817495 RepID=UPI003643C3AD